MKSQAETNRWTDAQRAAWKRELIELLLVQGGEGLGPRTQAELAKESRIDKAEISRIINGDRDAADRLLADPAKQKCLADAAGRAVDFMAVAARVEAISAADLWHPAWPELVAANLLMEPVFLLTGGSTRHERLCGGELILRMTGLTGEATASELLTLALAPPGSGRRTARIWLEGNLPRGIHVVAEGEQQPGSVQGATATRAGTVKFMLEMAPWQALQIEQLVKVLASELTDAVAQKRLQQWAEAAKKNPNAAYASGTPGRIIEVAALVVQEGVPRDDADLKVRLARAAWHRACQDRKSPALVHLRDDFMERFWGTRLHNSLRARWWSLSADEVDKVLAELLPEVTRPPQDVLVDLANKLEQAPKKDREARHRELLTAIRAPLAETVRHQLVDAGLLRVDRHTIVPSDHQLALTWAAMAKVAPSEPVASSTGLIDVVQAWADLALPAEKLVSLLPEGLPFAVQRIRAIVAFTLRSPHARNDKVWLSGQFRSAWFDLAWATAHELGDLWRIEAPEHGLDGAFLELLADSAAEFADDLGSMNVLDSDGDVWSRTSQELKDFDHRWQTLRQLHAESFDLPMSRPSSQRLLDNYLRFAAPLLVPWEQDDPAGCAAVCKIALSPREIDHKVSKQLSPLLASHVASGRLSACRFAAGALAQGADQAESVVQFLEYLPLEISLQASVQVSLAPEELATRLRRAMSRAPAGSWGPAMVEAVVQVLKKLGVEHGEAELIRSSPWSESARREGGRTIPAEAYMAVAKGVRCDVALREVLAAPMHCFARGHFQILLGALIWREREEVPAYTMGDAAKIAFEAALELYRLGQREPLLDMWRVPLARRFEVYVLQRYASVLKLVAWHASGTLTPALASSLPTDTAVHWLNVARFGDVGAARGLENWRLFHSLSTCTTGCAPIAATSLSALRNAPDLQFPIWWRQLENTADLDPQSTLAAHVLLSTWCLMGWWPDGTVGEWLTKVTSAATPQEWWCPKDLAAISDDFRQRALVELLKSGDDAPISDLLARDNLRHLLFSQSPVADQRVLWLKESPAAVYRAFAFAGENEAALKLLVEFACRHCPSAAWLPTRIASLPMKYLPWPTEFTSWPWQRDILMRRIEAAAGPRERLYWAVQLADPTLVAPDVAAWLASDPDPLARRWTKDDRDESEQSRISVTELVEWTRKLTNSGNITIDLARSGLRRMWPVMFSLECDVMETYYAGEMCDSIATWAMELDQTDLLAPLESESACSAAVTWTRDWPVADSLWVRRLSSDTRDRLAERWMQTINEQRRGGRPANLDGAWVTLVLHRAVEAGESWALDEYLAPVALRATVSAPQPRDGEVLSECLEHREERVMALILQALRGPHGRQWAATLTGWSNLDDRLGGLLLRTVMSDPAPCELHQVEGADDADG